MTHKKTPTTTKQFRFWIPPVKHEITRLEWYALEDHPKVSLRRIRYLRDAQKSEAHEIVNKLLEQVDKRIEWARTRSQSESWWNLKTRSCLEHYALIDGFNRWARDLKDRITWALMSAVWLRLYGESWRDIHKPLNEANALVAEINGAFR
tara:strand:- start:487 stop:936 length:450 start_codon:yes stop_codon:yes gene_type:complete